MFCAARAVNCKEPKKTKIRTAINHKVKMIETLSITMNGAVNHNCARLDFGIFSIFESPLPLPKSILFLNFRLKTIRSNLKAINLHLARLNFALKRGQTLWDKFFRRTPTNWSTRYLLRLAKLSQVMTDANEASASSKVNCEWTNLLFSHCYLLLYSTKETIMESENWISFPTSIAPLHIKSLLLLIRLLFPFIVPPQLFSWQAWHWYISLSLPTTDLVKEQLQRWMKSDK